jgi:hypothetical protein
MGKDYEPKHIVGLDAGFPAFSVLRESGEEKAPLKESLLRGRRKNISELTSEKQSNLRGYWDGGGGGEDSVKARGCGVGRIVDVDCLL